MFRVGPPIIENASYLVSKRTDTNISYCRWGLPPMTFFAATPACYPIPFRSAFLIFR